MKGPTDDTQPEQPVGRDKAITIDEVALTGVYFEPQALAQPAMPGIEGKVTVKAQRKAYQRAKKPEAKIQQGVILSVLLWGDVATRPEALKVLRELNTPAATVEVLFLLAVAEQNVGDPAKAAEAWDALIQRFPKDPNALVFKAYRAELALTQHDDGKAAELVGAADPAAADVPSELAYVAAWLRFHKGDEAGAWKAIAATSKKWRDPRSLGQLRRDIMVMGARAHVPPAEVMGVLEATSNRDRTKLVETLDALAQQYHYAGEYDSLSLVFDKRAEGATAGQLAEIRNVQALVDLRLGRPEKAAERILAAWAQAQKAGTELADPAREAIVTRLLDLAMRFHSVYAKSFDDRYGETAKKLYDAYLTIPGRPDTDKVKNEYIPNLQATVADKATLEGEHSQDAVTQAVRLRQEELSACYEKALQSEAKLAGKVKLMFDITQEGKTTNVVFVDPPKGGPSGLPAVATCIRGRIEKWAFSARKTPGITRVTLPMAFSPAAP